jgi:hypothetical protein
MAIGVDPQRLKAALDELNSTVCVCGRKKGIRRSFCRACYFRLPWDVRAGLYKHVCDSYVLHWENAKDWLARNPEEKVEDGNWKPAKPETRK